MRSCPTRSMTRAPSVLKAVVFAEEVRTIPSLSNSCFWLSSGTKGASVKGELNFRKMSSVSLAYPFTGFSSPGGFHKWPNVPLWSCKSLSTAVKCESFTFANSVRHNDFCLAQKTSKLFSNGLPKAKLHTGKLLATFRLPNAAALSPVSQSCLEFGCAGRFPSVQQLMQRLQFVKVSAASR